MRAHFASDVPASPDTDVVDSPENDAQYIHSATAASQEQLKSRIMEFKSDSTKMAIVGEFIDDVLEKAEEEANKQQETQNKNSQQNKNKIPKQNFKNGKVVNKARGFVVRLFESICNCANNAAAAPVNRFKFRSGKRSSTSAPDDGAADTNGKSGNMKKEEKSNKAGNGKQKKNAGIKFKEDKEEVEQETIELQ